MPQPQLSGDHIAKARAGVIDTPVLETVRGIAHDVAHGQTVDHASAELFLLCAPALLDELVDYRRRAAAALDLDPPANVIPFRGV